MSTRADLRAVDEVQALPVTLADAIATLERLLPGVPVHLVPAVVGDLARLQAVAHLHLIEGPSRSTEPDLGLLGAEEAAEALATTPDWLYRHASKLPFTVSLSKGQLRFSKSGIRDFIARGGTR